MKLLSSLDGYDRALAEPLADKFGENIIVNCFSSKWQNRAQGLFKTKEQLRAFRIDTIRNDAEKEKLVLHLFRLVIRGLSDKISAVNVEALTLYRTVLKTAFASFRQFTTHQNRDDYGVTLNTIINLLILKIGDSNSSSKSMAFEALLESTSHPIITHEAVVQAVIMSSGLVKTLSEEQQKLVRTSTKIQA